MTQELNPQHLALLGQASRIVTSKWSDKSHISDGGRIDEAVMNVLVRRRLIVPDAVSANRMFYRWIVTPAGRAALDADRDGGSKHSIMVEDGRMRLMCESATDAMCHAVWDCDCEEWAATFTAEGKPMHGVLEDEFAHVGRFDPDYCNIADWINESGIEDQQVAGDFVRFPVEVTWTGHGYQWERKP